MITVGTETFVDVVFEFGLQPITFDKKSYTSYLKVLNPPPHLVRASDKKRPLPIIGIRPRYKGQTLPRTRPSF
jgi:hypothetical protein